jgi:FMN phosphatase YigB (HAD superfamily)
MISDCGQLRAKIAGASGIIFDLDDTLYGVSDYDQGAYEDVARRFLRTDSEAAVAADRLLKHRAAMGKNYKYLFDDFAGWYELPPEAVSSCIDCYHRHDGRHMSPSRSLHDLLVELKGEGVAIVIASNGRTATQIRKIQRLELQSAVDAIYIGDVADPTRPLKPAVAGWHRLRNEARCPLALVVGDDEEVDGDFARAAGLSYVHFKFPHQELPSL